MKNILNFTQHQATPEQIAAGVVEPESADKEKIQRAITFECPPSSSDLRLRATVCALLARDLMAKYDCDAVLIGGAPFFMSHLESALRSFRVRLCYAFSSRVAEEQMQPDGSVKKVNVFRHLGFIWEDE
jgi:hypothetical protein